MAEPVDVAADLGTEQIERISRAVADPRRFCILQQIAANGELSCGALHVQDSLSPATISHHLKELHAAGLIEVERQGRGMTMSLRREVWAAYCRRLAAL